jgi:enamine deaminase RidA (YjgF/YER057c/UK114 family)
MINELITSKQAATKLSVTRAGIDQLFLVASVRSSSDALQTARESYVQIAEVLREHQLEIVHERMFGSLSVEPFVMSVRNDALQTCGIHSNNPVTYIEGNPPWGEGYAGTIIRAVSPNKKRDVWTIMDGNHPCGRGWRRREYTYLFLQNINWKDDGSEKDEKRPLQVRLMLDRAERILRENGASYSDVVRTWFYLSDILDWYATFNKARNEKYGEFGIMPGPGDRNLLLPASTGIRGDTPLGAAAMDLIAIIGEEGMRPEIKQLTNATQLDAFRYGSAFSRGALIREPGVSLIEVSGTAAIDWRGKSQFPDDIRGQISCTFEKIENLLGQEGAGLGDIAAATVFVKRPEHASLFWKMARDHGLEEFPAVCVVADVCRDELLFEIDGQAVVDGGIK